MKQFLKKTAIFFIILIHLDLSLSTFLDVGRPPDYVAFIDSKAEYDRLREVDVLFIGDSQTADGFVPTVFQEKLGGTAFNYGIYQLSPFEGYYLLKDLLSRRSEPPRLVVLGTNILMFNYNITSGRYTPLFIEDYRNLFPLLIKSEQLGAISAAGKKMYLLPAAIRTLVTGQANTRVRRQVQDVENGYLQNLKHVSNERDLACDKDKLFFNPDFVPQQKEFFLKTIEYLQEQQIPFVVVNPPVHRDFLDCMEQTTTYQNFQAVLSEIEAVYGAEIINRHHHLLIGDLQDGEFFNGDHLCYPGARKFSAVLADSLTQQGFRFNRGSMASR